MRVLVVEDEPTLRESLKWGLAAEGYVVDVAATGTDGLWQARQGVHDVIILDVMLPGLDGYQICTRLRAEGHWTPVLMLTAMDDDLDQAEGLDSGADDYLPKPFAYPVLLARLRALTRRGLAARPAALVAGGVTCDPGSRVVTRDGVDVELTGREFAVLEYLMRRAGQVVSKTDLVDHCWDPAADTRPAVVEVVVHRLRRKLEPEGGPPLIVTVRSGGYRIDAGR